MQPWIYRHSAHPYFKMKVRTRRCSRRTNRRNILTHAYRLAYAHIRSAAMLIQRRQSVTMINHYVVPSCTVISHGCYRTACSRIDWASCARRIIASLMVCTSNTARRCSASELTADIRRWTWITQRTIPARRNRRSCRSSSAGISLLSSCRRCRCRRCRQHGTGGGGGAGV